MREPQVGSDIGALCGKCGDVWHVVIARAGGRIAQVECKQCGARHRFRPPPGERGAKAGASPRGARKAASRSGAPSAESMVVADLSRPPRNFDPRETYVAGDRLLHTSFGEGVVQAVTGGTKIRVHFDSGAKVLVHARG
jgi:hypothetical protein